MKLNIIPGPEISNVSPQYTNITKRSATSPSPSGSSNIHKFRTITNISKDNFSKDQGKQTSYKF